MKKNITLLQKAGDAKPLIKYSKMDIGRAGQLLKNTNLVVIDPNAHLDALKALSHWRACHIIPLDAAVSELVAVTQKDRSAIVAKRLKRTPSIIAKMIRHQSMELQNMQDIGGCRVILRSVRHVNKVRRALKRRLTYREKNYIDNPKDDGYRGIHLVGKFPGQVRNTQFAIEIQLRTEIQHAWATAVEIIDLFTKQSLKSNQGKPEWKAFFLAAGAALSVLDGVAVNEDSHQYICSEVAHLAKRLSVLEKFEAYNASLRILDAQGIKWVEGYYLLQIDTGENTLKYDFFSITEYDNAIDSYLERERENAKKIDVAVALVSTNSLSSLKEAYPNYFADSHKFIQHLQIIIARHKVANPTWVQRLFLGLSNSNP